MIIGLDIDDVIFATSKYIMGALGDFGDSELSRYKVDIMRGDTDAPGVKEFLAKYLPLAIKDAKVMDGAPETIKKLRDAGNKIILITARGDKSFPGVEKLNEEVLARNGIEYDKIVYNQSRKVESCAENGVEVFVDDSPKNCVEVSNELGIPVIGFESDVTAEELHKNGVPCVKNWQELEERLNLLCR